MLQELPEELVVLILWMLSVPDMLKCRLVSRLSLSELALPI